MVKKWIWTRLKYKVNEIVKESNLNTEKEYKQFIIKLEEFYEQAEKEWHAKENSNFTKELLKRRREIKGGTNYLINVGSGVVSGLITGVGITAFPFDRLGVYNHIDNPDPLGFLFWALLAVVTVLIIFGVAYIYNVLNKLLNPYQTYAEERELEIIEKIIENKLGDS